MRNAMDSRGHLSLQIISEISRCELVSHENDDINRRGDHWSSVEYKKVLSEESTLIFAV